MSLLKKFFSKKSIEELKEQSRYDYEKAVKSLHDRPALGIRLRLANRAKVNIEKTFLEAANFNIPKVLEGKSFLPVLLGKNNVHKKYVYGLMTTKGINNGSKSFGIRSVRDDRYKFIWNFTPDIEFENACTHSLVFKSWIKKAQAGDADAKERVRRYQWRPEIEVYDLKNDPYEWNNIAGTEEVKKVQNRLSGALKKWMNSQGDLGQETELAALERQRRGKKKGASQKKNKS